MKMKLFGLSLGKSLLIAALLLGSTACGPASFTDERAFRRVAIKAATSSGAFAGNWKVTLKNTSDGCDMGLTGKSYSAKVAITQQRQKVTITIQGFPKSFKGSVSGTSASGTGSYTSDGITLKGSVSVTKTGTRKIKVNSANINLSTSAKSCKLTFSGSGTKA